MASGTSVVALLAELRQRRWTIGTAESLTGGLVAAAIIDVSGASTSMRGGIVAYDARVKRDLLGVGRELLESHGAVHPQVAEQMAEGVRRALSVDGSPVDVGLSTTGIAGPESPDGQPVGLVYLGVATPYAYVGRRRVYEGTREEIRRQATEDVLILALESLGTPTE